MPGRSGTASLAGGSRRVTASGRTRVILAALRPERDPHQRNSGRIRPESTAGYRPPPSASVAAGRRPSGALGRRPRNPRLLRRGFSFLRTRPRGPSADAETGRADRVVATRATPSKTVVVAEPRSWTSLEDFMSPAAKNVPASGFSRPPRGSSSRSVENARQDGCAIAGRLSLTTARDWPGGPVSSSWAGLSNAVHQEALVTRQ